MLSQDDRRLLISGLTRSFDAASFTRFVRLLRQEKASPSRALSRIPHEQLIPHPSMPGPPPGVIPLLVESWCQVGLGTLSEALRAAERACGGFLDPQLGALRNQIQAQIKANYNNPLLDEVATRVQPRAAHPPQPPSSVPDIATWEPVPGRDDDWGEGEHTSVVDASLWQSLEMGDAVGSGGPGGYVVGAGDSEFEATQAKTVGHLLEDFDLDDISGADPADPADPSELETTDETPPLRSISRAASPPVDLPTSTLDPSGFEAEDGGEDAEEEIERTVALDKDAQAALLAMRKELAAQRAPAAKVPAARAAAAEPPRAQPAPRPPEAPPPAPRRPSPPPVAAELHPALNGENPLMQTRELSALSTGAPPPAPPEAEDTTRALTGAAEDTLTGGSALGGHGEQTRILEAHVPQVPAPRAGAFNPRQTIRSPHGMPMPKLPATGAPSPQNQAPRPPPAGVSAPSPLPPRPTHAGPITLNEVAYLPHIKGRSGGFVELSFSGIPEGLHALRLQGEGFEPTGTLSFEGRSGYRGLDMCYGRQAYAWFNPTELDDLLHRKVRYQSPDGRSSQSMPITKAGGLSSKEVTPPVPDGASWVPPGVFLIPSKDEARVQRDRFDSGFFLSTHPVSHAEYERFIDATGYHPRIDADFLRQRVDGRFPGALSEHPVVYVSLADARAYAQWIGGRLPTEVEWQRAVSGLDGRPFPWGSEMEAARVNSRESRHGWSTPRGALPAGRGPFGHEDLLGNVWEWTETADDRTDPPHHVIKGGAWVSGLELAHVDARSFALATTRQFYLGFRVAWDRPGAGESTVAS